jgi:hypothetical protein
MDDKLTIREGYLAMIEYLENLYRLTGSDDLGGFLGAMELMDDSFPRDQAAWSDWLKAIEKVKASRDDKNV